MAGSLNVSFIVDKPWDLELMRALMFLDGWIGHQVAVLFTNISVDMILTYQEDSPSAQPHF